MLCVVYAVRVASTVSNIYSKRTNEQTKQLNEAHIYLHTYTQAVVQHTRIWHDDKLKTDRPLYRRYTKLE